MTAHLAKEVLAHHVVVKHPADERRRLLRPNRRPHHQLLVPHRVESLLLDVGLNLRQRLVPLEERLPARPLFMDRRLYPNNAISAMLNRWLTAAAFRATNKQGLTTRYGSEVPPRSAARTPLAWWTVRLSC